MPWISGHINRTNKVDVIINDQITPPFQHILMREDKTDILLTSIANRGDYTINVTSGHGFTAIAGETVVLMEGENYHQTSVVSVSTDIITLRTPIPNTFSTSAIVIRGNVNMNVDGSSTPQEFVYYKRSGVPMDVQYAHITIWNVSVQGDDGTFGDLAELTNGLIFQKDDGINVPLGNYKTNTDFKEFGANLSYNDKSGGTGQYGIDASFDIKKVYGVVIRLDPDTNDKFIAIVRDNLSTLPRLRVAIMGQTTLGE